MNKDLLLNQIGKLMGPIDDVFEITDQYNNKIDIAVQMPKERKEVYTLITVGFSEFIDKEIALTLPASWDAGHNDSNDWLFRQIIELYHRVSSGELDLQLGKCVKLIQKNEKEKAYPEHILFISLDVEVDKNTYLIFVEDRVVEIIYMVPIFEEERRYVEYMGANIFVDRLSHVAQRQVVPLDLTRENTCYDFNKNLKISQKQSIEMTSIKGYCIASDSIMVDGEQIYYFHKIETEADDDTGWRFFSKKDMEQEYLKKTDFGVYSLNHILNYDKELLIFFDMDKEVAFQRGEYDIFEEVCVNEKMRFLETIIDDTENEDDVLYDGEVHIDKIKIKKLDVQEISGLTHLAIYIQYMIVNDYMSEEFYKKYYQVVNGVKAQGILYPLREWIKESQKSKIYKSIFNDEIKEFSKYYFDVAINIGVYPQDIDEYTKARYEKENRDKKIAKTEEYLFIPYDQEYYDNMSEMIGKKLKYWKEVVLPRRKEGILNQEMIDELNDLLYQMSLPNSDLGYMDIHSFLIEASYRLVDYDIFTEKEVLSDGNLAFTIAELLMKEERYEHFQLIMHHLQFTDNEGVPDHIVAKWHHYYGYSFLRMGVIEGAFHIFLEGTKIYKDYIWNWYYLAIISYILGDRKELMEYAIKECKRLGRSKYYVKKLIEDINENRKPEEILLHYDNKRADDKLNNQVRENPLLLNRKDYEKWVFANSVTIAEENIEKIMNIALKRNEAYPTVETGLVLFEIKDKELLLEFEMTMGFLSRIDIDFLQRLFDVINDDRYYKVKMYDGSEYKLYGIKIKEDYSMLFRYVEETEDGETTGATKINYDEKWQFEFPSPQELKEKFEEDYKNYQSIQMASKKVQ